MPDRCTDPTCEQHWPAPMPYLIPALDAAMADFGSALEAAVTRALQPPDLAALIVQALIDTAHPTCYIAGNDTDALTVDGQVNLRAVADYILSRWRLVPIIQRDLCGTNELGIPHDRGSLADDGCAECVIAERQFRAAREGHWTELDVIHSQPPPYPQHQQPCARCAADEQQTLD